MAGVAEWVDEFVVLESEGVRGAAGLERYGRLGLLRSVVMNGMTVSQCGTTYYQRVSTGYQVVVF